MMKGQPSLTDMLPRASLLDVLMIFSKLLPDRVVLYSLLYNSVHFVPWNLLKDSAQSGNKAKSSRYSDLIDILMFAST